MYKKTPKMSLAVLAFSALALAGCDSSSSNKGPEAPNIPDIPEVPKDPDIPEDPVDPVDPVDPPSEVTWYQPTPMTTWHLQYQGDLLDLPVEFYVVDMFDTTVESIGALKASGSKVGCYISVGTLESWRPDASEFLEADTGNQLPWDGENYLNINSRSVQNLMVSRIELAASKGCDAVEFSASDTYSEDTGFDISMQDQIDFNILLAEAAHNNSLGAGLKNSLLLVEHLVDHYDFSINTSCFEYSECDYLDPFIEANKAVFNIQNEQIYKDDQTQKEALCVESVNKMFSTLFLEWSFDGSYRETCLGG